MPGGRAVWTRRTGRGAGTGWTWSSECFQLVVVVTVCSCFMFDLVSGTCIRLEALLKLNSTGCDGCLMNIVFNCQDMFFFQLKTSEGNWVYNADQWPLWGGGLCISSSRSSLRYELLPMMHCSSFPLLPMLQIQTLPNFISTDVALRLIQSSLSMFSEEREGDWLRWPMYGIFPQNPNFSLLFLWEANWVLHIHRMYSEFGKMI